jgi:GNAT superfamily N-acetyltransferase
MTLEIQQATPNHAPQIADVKRRVWADEQTDEALIARVIAEPDHITHIAIEDNQVVGFVDGFLTMGTMKFKYSDDDDRMLEIRPLFRHIPPKLKYRWEVDLLAVLPEYRGKGIASRLIEANMEQGGRYLSSELMRALIAVGNVGSEKAFARCGFKVQDNSCGLFVSGNSFTETVPFYNRDLYLLPVNTFNYRGIWLEGNLSPLGFRKAQSVRTHHQWDTAGAVIPMNMKKAVTAAQEAGYTLVGEYRWWIIENAVPKRSSNRRRA